MIEEQPAFQGFDRNGARADLVLSQACSGDITKRCRPNGSDLAAGSRTYRQMGLAAIAGQGCAPIPAERQLSTSLPSALSLASGAPLARSQ